MARDFTKNTSNWMGLGLNQIGALANGASAISVHAWANVDTISAGVNDNLILVAENGGDVFGFAMCVDGSAATKTLLLTSRSFAAGTRRTRNATSSFTTGAWHSCGGVFNYAVDTITPYFDGVAENGGAAVFGGTPYVNSGAITAFDTIGCSPGTLGTGPAVTANQFDGRIAEVSVWVGDIGAAGFAALNRGVSAKLISPHLLRVNFPLYGSISPERDPIRGLTGTITGTIAQADSPRIFMPKRRQLAWGDATANTAINPGAGSIAITGYAPTIAQSANQAVTPGAGSVAITGYAPTVAQSGGQAISPGVGSVAITGYAPAVTQSANQALTPSAGSIAITGYAPTVTQASASQNITPSAGQITITGYAPTVTQGSTWIDGGGGYFQYPNWQPYWLDKKEWEEAVPSSVAKVIERIARKDKPPDVAELELKLEVAEYEARYARMLTALQQSQFDSLTVLRKQQLKMIADIEEEDDVLLLMG